MSAYLTNEQKDQIFAEYGGSATNTGSVEGQVALFTHRITAMSSHLHTNRKDFGCKTAMLSLVGKRKRLLTYLAKRDIVKYRELIEKLNIRK